MAKNSYRPIHAAKRDAVRVSTIDTALKLDFERNVCAEHHVQAIRKAGWDAVRNWHTVFIFDMILPEG